MSNKHALQAFLNELASGMPTPGGGSAAAAVGAMGAALVSMVCNLTIGREKFAGVEAQMKETLARSETLRAELSQLMTDDIEAYQAVMAAYRLPKGTKEEKAARTEAIQAGLKQATLTPLATARACAEVIELGQFVVESGNPNAASDAGAGAACAQAGLKAATLNVLINLSSIKDEVFVSTHQTELNQILSKHNLADEIHESVKSRL
jgi:formiminotetrahydrofolate cyclodeaminase